MHLVDIPERHLPSDFTDRLVKSVRRRRRVRRVRLAVVLIVTSVLCMGLVGELGRKGVEDPPREDRLIATHEGAPGETCATGFLMLGFFKERFKRSKPLRKKDED